MARKFNPEDYENVEDRLKVFWKDNPDGRIDSDVIHITTDGTCVTIRSEIYKHIDDARPVTTGIAQETKGQGSFANAASWMENCETSAIGRALANWKYQGSNKPRPSREEMNKVINDDEPKKKQVAQKTGTSPSDDDNDLQNIILDLCNKDKTLANKVWKFALNSMQIKKGVPDKVKDYDEDHKKQFIEIASQFLKKNQEEFAKRKGEPEYMDVVRENLDDVEIKEEQVGERPPSGAWEQDPPTEAQLEPFNQVLKRAADNDIELYEKAKKALNDGTITKGNIYDWINREDSPWVLQDGSK